MPARVRTYGANLKPHAYELLMVASFIAAEIFVRLNGLNIVAQFAPTSILNVGRVLAGTMIAGVVVRVLGGLVVGGARAYLRQVFRWTWWLESARLLFFGALATHLYSSLKVLMPRLTSRNADAFLWELDRKLLFGFSPSVLMVELFKEPLPLRVVDWTYHYLFAATLWAVFAIALSSPSQRIRVSFVGAKAALWVVGTWLYYTLPSLGPAYRFQPVWENTVAHMPLTFGTLKTLMDNYLIVIGARPGRVNFLYGIGAFPSLHVAFQVFVALWVRRFTRLGGGITIAAAIIIFVGSLVTGWHYLADSLAGIVLAVAAYWILFRLYRIDRWLRLFRRVRRPRARLDRFLMM